MSCPGPMPGRRQGQDEEGREEERRRRRERETRLLSDLRALRRVNIKIKTQQASHAVNIHDFMKQTLDLPM